MRDTTERIDFKKNIQTSRIFNILDPNVCIIYVLPFPISEEVKKYYFKLLNLLDVENFEERIKFIVPSCWNVFPK